MDPELQALFEAEMETNLTDFERAVLALEQNPGDADQVGLAFGSMHNLKGGAGLMQMDDLGRLAHVAEELLEDVRSGVIQFDKGAIDELLKVTDCARSMVDGEVPPEAVELGRRIAEHRERLLGASGSEAPADTELAPDSGKAPTDDPSPTEAAAAAPKAVVGRVSRSERLAQQQASEAPPEATPEVPEAVVVETPAIEDEVPEAETPATEDEVPEVDVPEVDVAEVDVAEVDVPEVDAAETVEADEEHPGTESAAQVAEKERTETIRVRVELLQDLVNYVGELVVARNRMLQLGDGGDPMRDENITRIDHLTSTLQDLVMKARMQPVHVAWSVMPRLVRDISSELGKNVELKMVGGDTEIDRSILGNLHDPILHGVRNALGHGIESPEERIAAGKPEVGHIELSAYQAGGQVHVEISDDGRGLDREAIEQKAQNLGLRSAENLKALSDPEVFELVFLPGFSTSTEVDSVSGRGVGMDVVQRRLASVGGTAEIESRAGQGTTLRLRIPLTLAIIPGMIVESHDRLFCVPQLNVEQVLDMSTEESRENLDLLAGSELYRLGDQLLPMVRLAQSLEYDDGTDPIHGYAVVVATAKGRYGLVVDNILDTEEVVVKPLGIGLGETGIFSGTTVRGDGNVMLILDVEGLMSRALGSVQNTATDIEELDDETLRSLLLIRVEEGHQAAIDVDSIVAVRSIVDSDISEHGGEVLVEHEGHPRAVRTLVPDPDSAEELLICQTGDSLIAIPVEQSLDLVHAHLEINSGVGAPWAEGVTRIDGENTSIVDLEILAGRRGNKTRQRSA